jgi:hypothetical protein
VTKQKSRGNFEEDEDYEEEAIVTDVKTPKAKFTIQGVKVKNDGKIVQEI